jgi:hypothetical protein
LIGLAIWTESENLNQNRDVSGGDGGGGDDGRSHSGVCFPVVPNVIAPVRDLVGPRVVAEKAVACLGIVTGTSVAVVPVEVVSEAYIVAVAAGGRLIVGTGFAMLDMVADMVNLVSANASPVAAESFESILGPPW